MARWGLGVALLLAASGAAAATAYVTDQLRLGMHRQEDTGDRAFKMLTSGTALEVLDRNTFYAHVRAPDGTEGWVKAAYLVDTKPAVLRVAELEAQNQSLSSELQQARTELGSIRGRASDLEGQIGSAMASATENTDTLERLQVENTEFRQRLMVHHTSVPLNWFLAALGVMLLLGFVGGFAWLDHRSRKRYGGFRIY